MSTNTQQQMTSSTPDFRLRDGQLVWREEMDLSRGGLFAVFEYRGQRSVSNERFDDKARRTIKTHRLVISGETMDDTGTKIMLEINGWETPVPPFPFERGKSYVASISGEYKGTYSLSAVAPYKGGKVAK